MEKIVKDVYGAKDEAESTQNVLHASKIHIAR